MKNKMMSALTVMAFLGVLGTSFAENVPAASSSAPKAEAVKTPVKKAARKPSKRSKKSHKAAADQKAAPAPVEQKHEAVK